MALARVIESLRELRAKALRAPGHGAQASLVEDCRQLFEHSVSLASAWSSLESVLVLRRNAEDHDEFWLSEPAAYALSEEMLVGRINRSFYSAFPGIVTGLGLLFTFVAILIALLGVWQDPSSQVIQGVPNLIHGLSGKFVSSIVALLLATVFIFCEKSLFHGLDRTRVALGRALELVFPRLTPVQILAELQRDIGEQTLGFRHFNSDLSGKLRQSFSESMGPTIQHMVETVDELNRLLRAAEAQKQESITGSLASMLQRLEGSITSSLGHMGDQFSESLSGTAMGQFTKVSEVLGGAAKVLGDMNAQFQRTQSALDDVVSRAKNSAVEQMAIGKTQVEELTNVLRQMMVQLNETTNASTSKMTETLSALVFDLSTKVADLNSQMAKSVEENASRASNAASAVIEQAGTWSTKSNEQLERILEQQKAHLQNVRDVETSLMSALEIFDGSVRQFAAIRDDLQKTARETGAMATAAAGSAHSTQESQKALQQVAANAAGQIERLAEANRSQQEVWESIRARMEQYRNVFAQADKLAAGVLSQITQGTNVHIEVTAQRYDSLVKLFDEHMSVVVQKLGGSLEELKEYMQDLSETVQEARKSLREQSRGPDGRRAA
jgi:ABC-type transporter Mla subunit MlaD